MKKVRNLNVSDVYGTEKSYVISRMGLKANTTAFAMSNGVMEKYCTDKYFLDDNDNEYNIVDSDSFGIRPVLRYSEIKDKINNYHVNYKGIVEVEYGYFPNYELSGFEALALNYGILNNSKHIKKLDNFKINITTKSLFDDNEPFINYPKFLFKNKIYLAEYCETKKEYCFYEYDSVKWLIDEEKDLAICKNIIMSGIPYRSFNMNNMIDSNEIELEYLNNEFIKEIESEENYKILKK